MTNSGSRTGFVSARLFKDEALRSKLDGRGATGATDRFEPAFHVEPKDFVLGVGESQVVTVIWRGSSSASNVSSMPLGFLAFFHGDEVMRARLKKIAGESALPLAKLPGECRVSKAGRQVPRSSQIIRSLKQILRHSHIPPLCSVILTLQPHPSPH